MCVQTAAVEVHNPDFCGDMPLSKTGCKAWGHKQNNTARGEHWKKKITLPVPKEFPGNYFSSHMYREDKLSPTSVNTYS